MLLSTTKVDCFTQLSTRYWVLFVAFGVSLDDLWPLTKIAKIDACCFRSTPNE